MIIARSVRHHDQLSVRRWPGRRRALGPDAAATRLLERAFPPTTGLAEWTAL